MSKTFIFVLAIMIGLSSLTVFSVFSLFRREQSSVLAIELGEEVTEEPVEAESIETVAPMQRISRGVGLRLALNRKPGVEEGEDEEEFEMDTSDSSEEIGEVVSEPGEGPPATLVAASDVDPSAINTGPTLVDNERFEEIKRERASRLDDPDPNTIAQDGETFEEFLQ